MIKNDNILRVKHLGEKQNGKGDYLSLTNVTQSMHKLRARELVHRSLVYKIHSFALIGWFFSVCLFILIELAMIALASLHLLTNQLI